MSPHSLPADLQNAPDSSTPEPSLIKGNISNPLVHSAIDYIHTHVQKRLSLSDVAEALKLNPSYISRLFKAHTNWNMTEYIRALKLSKAKKLLKSGGYTVTELSELFGFSSIHYFSSCFKNNMGLRRAITHKCSRVAQLRACHQMYQLHCAPKEYILSGRADRHHDAALS